MEHKMRLATERDGEAILGIYAPYIADTAVSFETEVPSIRDFRERIRGITRQYPYLVYELDGEIVAYAYASKHHERAAYCYDVDVSIYAREQFHGMGITSKLYHCLFSILKEQGYYNAYAAYTIPNEKSKRFHHKLGFTPVGVFRKTGYKFGKWYDVMWLEKTISDHQDTPSPTIKAITELPDSFLQALWKAVTERND